MRHVVQRSSWSGFAILSLVLVGLTVVSGGTVLALSATGMIDLPFFKKQEVADPNLVLVAVSAMEIPAYTRITRDHIWDTKRGVFSTSPVSKPFITADMYVSLDQFKGRVLRRNKPKGYAFTESDFLPKGTREGIVGGIPPGKRSVVLDASKLNGVFGLRAGDHLDILASQKLDLAKSMGNRGMAGPQAAFFSSQKQASTRVIVQDGVIVMPVTNRAKPVTSNSLTQGTQAKTVPVQEVTIAVSPEEVAPLNSAIAVESQLNCVARSGQVEEMREPAPTANLKRVPPKLGNEMPEQDAGIDRRKSSITTASSHTPGDNPLETLTFMEGLIGSKKGITRQQLIFPQTGRGPIDLNQPILDPPIASQPGPAPPVVVPETVVQTPAGIGSQPRATIP